MKRDFLSAVGVRPLAVRAAFIGATYFAACTASCRSPDAPAPGGGRGEASPATAKRDGFRGDRFVVLDSKAPIVAIKILIDAGSADDPPGKEGLAALAADALLEGGFGTPENPVTKEELAELVLPWGDGALPRAQVSAETTTLHFAVPREVLRAYVETVLLPILSRPLFLEGEVERLKGELASLVSAYRLENLEGLGLLALDEFVFEGTGYAHPIFGTETSVPDLTRDDVVAFWRQRYPRARLVLVGVSSGDPEVLALVQSAVDALRRVRSEGSPLEPPPPRAPAPFRGRHAVVVEMPNAPAASLHLGFPISITRADPDFWPLYVANVWLGVHRDSFGRLYQAIREERGYNYGDYSYIEYWSGRPGSLFPIFNQPRLRQYFSIWVRPVQHEYAAHILKAITWELDRLVREGLTEAEVAAAKTKARVLYLNLAETVDRLVADAIDSAYYGMDAPFLSEYLAAIDAVTPERVNAAVRRHLQVDDLKYVVVTDPAHAEHVEREILEDAPAWGKGPAEYEIPRVSLSDGAEVLQVPVGKLETLRLDAVWAHFPLRIRDVRRVPVTALFKTGAFIAE